ncbi:MAG: class I SAM-dependent methyltransferase, partial [Candidatus Helarchaeales archaeon]
MTSRWTGLAKEQEIMVFYTLVARARFSKEMNNDFKDELAEVIVEKLGINLDETELASEEAVQLGCVARAMTIDTMIKEFLMKHPRATIVNIGAGLDTTFFRVDNGLLMFYNLDLPDVAEIRQGIIPDSPRQKTIGRSAFDHGWMDEIKFEPDSGIFFFASGVFQYFPEEKLLGL